MSFFSFLFPRPLYIDDAVFGRLRREGINKCSGKAWFANDDLTFAPTGQRISVCLDAPETGPTAAQQAFYLRIEQDYTMLIARLAPLIEDEFQGWRPDFCINDFTAEFWPTGISIPELEYSTPEVAWDWSFETIHDANHMLTFYMSGSTPLPGMQMDG